MKVKFAAGRQGKKAVSQDFLSLASDKNVEAFTFPVVSRTSRFSRFLASSSLSGKINPLDIESFGVLTSLLKLRNFLRDVDILEVNYPAEAFLFPFLPEKTKKIIHFHGPWLTPVVNRCRKILLNHITAGIACSQWTAKELARRWPGLPVEVVYNGVDIALFQPFDGDTSFDIAEGYDPSLPRFGLVARLSRNKGVHLLFRVARKMLGRAEFFIVGMPDAEFAKELASYNDLPNFHVIGPIPNANLPVFYNFIDCFVLPTFFENFSITILEAMACGLPVITSNVGGVPEAVIDGKNGFLLPPGDDEALFMAVKRMSQQSALRRQMGAFAIEFVRERFSLDMSLRSTLRVYDKLMAEKDKAGR
jgi:glycosyltransferase involved in cell wall biosynthesis